MTDGFSSTHGTFPGFAFQVPETFRSITETGVEQARDGYAILRDAADSGNQAIGAMLETATRGAGLYTGRVLELSRVNTQAVFDFSVALMNAASLPEALELVGGQTRRQIETFMAQSKELTELGQRVAAETFAPIRSVAARTLAAVA